MSIVDAPRRCSPSCRCIDDDEALYRATERAYEMVFKGPMDFFVLKAALELGLFTALAEAPMSTAALAERTGAIPVRLERLLIAMDLMGMVQPAPEGWALTAFSAQFFTAPDEHRNLTMLPFMDYMVEMVDRFYSRLADVARGTIDFTSHVPYPPRTREDNVFYETLHRSNIHFVRRLLLGHAALDGVGTLTDVGGGIGDIAIALCERHPQLQVTLINLPSAIDLVRENLADRGMAGRITPVAIDMYREPYPQGDAVLFSRILYPMNPQFSTMLLKKAYDSLAPGGRVLIVDMVISDRANPNYDYLSHYLCSVGMPFSVLDFKDHAAYPGLLREVGFTDVTLHEGYGHVLYQAVKG